MVKINVQFVGMGERRSLVQRAWFASKGGLPQFGFLDVCTRLDRPTRSAIPCARMRNVCSEKKMDDDVDGLIKARKYARYFK